MRVQIEFTKPNGKMARRWETAPKTWASWGSEPRRTWARSVAARRCKGATGAKVIGEQ